MGDFIVIAHCKRGEAVPHWLHQATLNVLQMPCRTVDLWEGHIFDIGASRQRLAETFMSIPEATHILFVDDDIIIPNPDSLKILHRFLDGQHERIVSGLYCDKSEHGICPTCGQGTHAPLIMTVNETTDRLRFGFPYTMKSVPKDQLFEVTCIPSGFLLIRREVFEVVESPWFVYADPTLHRKLRGSHGPGEDVYFSLKAREAGFRLWVDTHVELLHYVPKFIGNQELISQVTGVSRTLMDQAGTVRREHLKELRNGVE